MKYRIAIRAFIAILFNKNHIYCDNNCHSIIGHREDVWDKIITIRDSANEHIIQDNLLTDAKEILKP